MKKFSLLFIKIFFVRIVFFAFYYTINFIPLRLHEPIANTLGWLGFHLSGKHRRVMLEHLKIAFEREYSEGERAKIALRSYQNMAKSSLEFFCLPRLSDEDVLRIMTVEGEEHLRDAAEAGKGSVIVSAHFGNWEILGARLAAMGYKLTAVGRDQSDILINDIIKRLRGGRGTVTIPRGAPVYEQFMTCLRNNELIGLVADQSAGSKGIFVDFFGRPASTFKGPGLFAIKSGSPIIPIFAVRRGYNKHHAVICPPVTIELTGDENQDIYLYAKAFTKVIEDMIRRYPDHWLWVHKRWKTLPPEK